MPEQPPQSDQQENLLRSLSRISDRDELPRPFRAALAQWVTSISQRREDIDVAGWVTRARSELKRIDDLLGDIERQVAESESVAGADLKIDAGWWRSRRRRISAARRDGWADEAIAAWLTAWALALAADEFELCLKISRSSVAEPSPSVAEATTKITRAVQEEYADDVSPELRQLLADEGHLSTESAAVLGVVYTRSLLESGTGLAEAEHTAEWLLRRLQAAPVERPSRIAQPRARNAQPDHLLHRWRALALAVRAEVDLAIENLESARRRLDIAMTLDQPPADVFVAAAKLAEAEEYWLTADAYCDQALDHGADPSSRALRRPIPARLRIRAASRLSESDPAAALHQIQTALASEISGEGEYPETEVLLEEARLLEQLSRGAEASEALVEAANRFVWSGVTTRALEIYERACAIPSAPATAWWWYAEALRLEALTPHDTVDLPVMRQAADKMKRGLQLRDPEPDEAWVLVTQGMIADSLTPEAVDGLVLLERALLQSEDYVLPYGFLAISLRRRGYLQAALTAAKQGAEADITSDFLRGQYISLLFDHADYQAGLEYVDQQRAQNPDADSLVIDYAMLQLRAGDPDVAIRTLEELPRDQSVRLALGTCHAAVGHWNQSRREFEVVWRETRDGGDPVLAGWAAYRTGRLAEAIDLYTTIAEQAPAHTSYTRDLGQMLLVRGEKKFNDLAEGEDKLRYGIANAVSADDLLELQRIELAVVRADVADRPHAAQVEEILRRLDPEIDRRRTELLTPQPLPDTLWGRLCRAREALYLDDPDTSFTIYDDLLSASEIPAAEARFGLSRAAMALFALADDLASAGTLDRARKLWNLLDRATDEIESGDTLAAALAARRAVAALASGDEPAQPHLDEALGHEALGHFLGARALTDAIELFAENRGALWRIYDGLTELAGHAGDLPGLQGATLGTLASQLPLQTSYRLCQHDLSIKETTRVMNALEVRLGAGHHSLADELRKGISDLRDQLAKEMGVRIPGVRQSPIDKIPADQVEFRVYAQVVDKRHIDPGSDAALNDLLGAFDQVLRSQLHRLLGPDDVRLWLAGWNPTRISAASWEPPDGVAALRLVRVLRMLLREGIAIGDRSRILEAFVAVDSNGDAGTPLLALRAVRCALGARALGHRPSAKVRYLPEHLEQRVAAPLSGPHRARWETDREQTWLLVRDLRAWLNEEASDDHSDRVVVVSDADVRPFVWRLLASDRPRVTVLAKEELR